MRKLVLTAIALAALTLPAHALTITARVSGGAVVHAGPHERYETLGRIANGTEVPVDECTQVDGDSPFGTLGDAGYPLWGRSAQQWCHIPDTGWVRRTELVGRGLVNVTPPDFAGPGW